MRTSCCATTNACPLCRYEPFLDEALDTLLRRIEEEIRVLRSFMVRVDEENQHLDRDLRRPTDTIRRHVEEQIAIAERERSSVTAPHEARALLDRMCADGGRVATMRAEWDEGSSRRARLQWRRRGLQAQLDRFRRVAVPRIAWEDAASWGDDAWALCASVAGDARELPTMFRRAMRAAAETLDVEAQTRFVTTLHDAVVADVRALEVAASEARAHVSQLLAPTFASRFEETRRRDLASVPAWLQEQVDYFRRIGFADGEMVRLMEGTSLETMAAARFARNNVRAFVASVVDQLQQQGGAADASSLWEEARARLEAGEPLPLILESFGERRCALDQLDYVVRQASTRGYVTVRTFKNIDDTW